ncbi:hypothetical protein HID58_070924 [Brassica napus]|uniref:Uncharacterized protein n=1 Tax=Brassica napus TaxID=3708 RepID=A0ABQ7Z0B2_BRANA|nr:hypothetical protein HID58_070924 [Brassica napus]
MDPGLNPESISRMLQLMHIHFYLTDNDRVDLPMSSKDPSRGFSRSTHTRGRPEKRILDEFFVLPSFKRMEEYPNHSSFPTSFLSGRMKPMQLFGSPFSSPSPTWDDAPEDGQLIDEEPLKGTKYRMPFGNRWNRSYLPTSIIRLGSIGEGRIDHCEEVETCFFLGESGGFVSLSYLGVEVPVVDVFEEYQKMMVLRRRSERGKLQSESLFLQLKVQSLIRHQMLTFQRVRVMALWELIHVWLDKRVEHWKPKEEFHQYQLIMGVDDD